MMNSEYYKSLPTKRMGSGVLFFNSQSEILLVQPTYKETWEIPGGVVETNESPRNAAIREVREELGIDLSSTLKLLCVEYMAGNAEISEALMFIFTGDPLTEKQISNIRPKSDEIRSFHFFTIEEAVPLLGTVLGDRVKKCALADECFYSEASY